MKKLLILMLVLGLASAANASVVQLSVDGVTNGAGTTATVDSITTIGVVSDGSDQYDPYYLVITDTTYGDYGTITIWQPHTDGGHAGDQAGIVDRGSYMGYDHWADISAKDTTPEDLQGIDAGTHFSAPITMKAGASETNTLTIDLYDTMLTLKDTVIVAVPEPMTIALLGIGALFLRRRK